MNKIPVINQIIKNKRKEKKITQVEFSKIINKSIGTVKRYDTGDIIPENTLILICDKLNLDMLDLTKKQYDENMIIKSNYYEDLISKSKISFLANHSPDIVNFNYNRSIIDRLIFIYKSFNYTSKDFIKAEHKNNRFYIFNKTDVLDILTHEQADKFITDMQEFFEFKIERLRKEKLNK